MAAALLLLILLFAGASYLSMQALEKQRKYNTLLNLTTHLDHTAQHIVSLGMNYAMHGAMDPTAYKRDQKLYYQGIKDQVEIMNQIAVGFVQQDFPPRLTGFAVPFRPTLAPSTQTAIKSIGETWNEFRVGLDDALYKLEQ